MGIRFLFILLFFWFACREVYSQTYQQEIDRLIQSGRYQIENFNQNIIAIENRISGKEKYVLLSDIDFDINNYIEDMQIFDLINEDTNLYHWRFRFSKVIDLSALIGYPLIISDLNNNNKLDLIGSYKIPNNIQPADCAIFELTDDSSFVLKAVYPDTVVTPLAATDLDKDGLLEINFKIEGGQEFYNYESKSSTTFPETLNFTYRMWEMGGAVGSETFTDLDKDGEIDVIYKGDDSLYPAGTKIYVAEYDPAVNNFVKRFSYRPANFNVSGISYDDFDQDGFSEFVTGSIDGDVYVFENTGNNSYAFTFADTIPTPNAYLTCRTNDIDGNGRNEFFVGGSSYYNGIGGTRVYWFESDGDNHYIKKYNFILLGTDVLGTTELSSYDVNADGRDDLVFAFGMAVVILTWNPQGYFEIYYLDWWEDIDQEIQSVILNNLFNRNYPDLIVSVEDFKIAPRLKSYIFKNDLYLNVQKNNYLLPIPTYIHQNYPNPFNSNTAIKFFLNKNGNVLLRIYDIRGKEVKDLILNQFMFPGGYSETWDGMDNQGKEVCSGIYLLQLQTSDYTESRKMLLIR
jgi:hypothetical protein